MIKVALDISKMHAFSKTRGIGEYAHNLYQSIKKYTDIDIVLVEEKTNLLKFNLIHYPFFDLFKASLPLSPSKPFVVTIPDLIPLQYPQYYPPGIKGRINLFRQKLALKKASSIIAISNTVKKDIVEILKFDPEKVFSIPLAPSDTFRKITDQESLAKTIQKYSLPEKFTLYVGNVNWNKNILNMAEAAIISKKPLVIIGKAFLDKSNLNHPEKKSFKEFLERYETNPLIKLLGFVEDEDLVRIMNLATVLLFTSFYEGFGLPILEAQAVGLPVITSKLSATAEIAKKGALLVNPENVQEILGAIKRIYSSDDFKKKLIDEGKENLQNFSWKKTALETVRVYKHALD